jgi:signal transduction histidine kinase
MSPPGISAMPPAEAGAGLAAEIFETLEERQSAIGELLHDTLCQTLGGATMMAAVLARRAAAGEPVEAGHLAQLVTLLDRSLDEIRAALYQLRPLPSGPRALMSALQQLATDTSRKVPCEFRCEEPILLDHAAASLALYRLASDAVQQAILDSATCLSVSLTKSDGCVEVAISAVQKAGASPGQESSLLRLMRSRAAIAGIILHREFPTDASTRLVCRWAVGAGT